MPRHSLAREQKKKKRKSLSQEKTRWVVLFKRRDFETRFSFSFLLRTRREKKIHSRQESFHLLQKRARALKEHRHTRAHKTRERKKKTTLFSSSLIQLFVYFVFVLFARTTEREKERRHFIISPLIKERRRH